ncbi:Hypothetical predicted protein, partial [Pelobates cultripes]
MGISHQDTSDEERDFTRGQDSGGRTQDPTGMGHTYPGPKITICTIHQETVPGMAKGPVKTTNSHKTVYNHRRMG